MQLTEVSRAFILSLGLVMTDHVLPFQDSISVCASMPARPSSSPTAMHDVAVGQLTELSPAFVGLAGLRITIQRPPFEDSTNA